MMFSGTIGLEDESNEVDHLKMKVSTFVHTYHTSPYHLVLCTSLIGGLEVD